VLGGWAVAACGAFPLLDGAVRFVTGRVLSDSTSLRPAHTVTGGAVPTEAMRWFEGNRAACGSPGLFTEEYDIEQRQLRGNYPQAFVHALLIESAKRLAEPTTEPMT